VALVVTVVLRLLQLAAVARASRAQLPTGPATPDGQPSDYYVFHPAAADPGAWYVLTNWDGQWYERIATIGYPAGAAARSANEAWAVAFPPAFPVLTRGVMESTGASFAVSAFLLNTVAVLGAVGLMYGLLHGRGVSDREATMAASALSLMPSSPVLIAAYSEAVALVFVMVALWALVRRHYAVCVVAVLALSLTRPVAVAFFAVVLVHALLRWRADGRSVPWVHRLGVSGVGAASVASVWVWPRLSRALYGTTQAGSYSGSDRTAVIVSGLGDGYLRTLWNAGPAVAAVVVLFFGLALAVPAVLALRAHWPVEIVVWGVAYLGVVVVATPVTPGFFRYLVLAGPLLAAVFAVPLRAIAVPRVVVVVVLVAGSLWLQWLWVRYLLVLDPAPSLYPWAP
jgi:hypothetical protein